MGRPLTSREVEVLWLVAEGLNNRQIAARLQRSTDTVKLHLRHAAHKLGTSSRTRTAVCFVLGRVGEAKDRGLGALSPHDAASSGTTREATVQRHAVELVGAVKRSMGICSTAVVNRAA